MVDHEEDDSVSFDPINTYHFRPDLSKGSKDDIVIIPDLFVMVNLSLNKRSKVNKKFRSGWFNWNQTRSRRINGNNCESISTAF